MNSTVTVRPSRVLGSSCGGTEQALIQVGCCKQEAKKGTGAERVKERGSEVVVTSTYWAYSLNTKTHILIGILVLHNKIQNGGIYI
jgi:hypothetical protein